MACVPPLAAYNRHWGLRRAGCVHIGAHNGSNAPENLEGADRSCMPRCPALLGLLLKEVAGLSETVLRLGPLHMPCSTSLKDTGSFKALLRHTGAMPDADMRLCVGVHSAKAPTAACLSPRAFAEAEGRHAVLYC